MVRIWEAVMETEGLVPGEKRVDLMDRAAQLFQELGGPRWSEIAVTLQKEGFLEDGKSLSSNALRKRFQKDPVLRKLLEDSRKGKPQRAKTPAPREAQVKRPGPPVTRPKRDNTKDHTPDEIVTAKQVLSLLQGTMQRRDEMLLEQIRKSNTGPDYLVIREIEDKMVNKMNEEWKRLEDELEQIEARLEILVEDKVEENLKSMVTPEGSFGKDLEAVMTKILDKRFSGEAGTLLSALPMTTGQAPGKWEGEGKMARFSATMPQHLYDAMKGLKDEASFSARIAAACDVYLRVLASQKGNTEYEKEE